VAEGGAADPLANGRVTLLGPCQRVDEDGGSARAAFLAAHPNSAYYADFSDFAFWKLRVNAIRYIGGYGRMSWISQADWQAAEPDPLAPSAAGMVAHMNADHADALASAVYNATLGPALTNQVLVGVNHFNQTFSDANSSFNPVALGFNTGVSGSDLAGAPFLSITGFDPTGVSPNSGRTDVTTHVSDSLSFTKGQHEVRVGGEIRRVAIEAFGAGGGNNAGIRGNFFFNGTQGPWRGLLSVPGYDTNIAALADFLAGYVYQSTILSGDIRREVDQNLFNLFAQDSWKVTRQLTVNLGLRWDFEGPMHNDQRDLSTFVPSLGGLVVAGQQIDDLYPRSWKNFSPRLGMTYQPNGRDDLVVRGGFGIFYPPSPCAPRRTPAVPARTRRAPIRSAIRSRTSRTTSSPESQCSGSTARRS
jgi:TonB dependent receptor/Pyridoxamine 5'-phosphate oxidase